jgi:hypothetical protein
MDDSFARPFAHMAAAWKGGSNHRMGEPVLRKRSLDKGSGGPENGRHHHPTDIPSLPNARGCSGIRLDPSSNILGTELSHV